MRSVLQHAVYAAQNAALLARSLKNAFQSQKRKEDETWGAGFGSYHERITLLDGLIDGFRPSFGPTPPCSVSVCASE